MKKFSTLIVIAVFTCAVYAQVPQRMSYQCVVRNSAGALLANQAVGMKISIRQGTATGTVIFSETYAPNPQTNANGLVTVEIGSGTATVGALEGIDWSAGPYFLETETDPAGGTAYTITGTSRLLTVPYAFYAMRAANGFSGSWADLTGIPSFATVATSGSYNDLLNRPSLFDGTWSSLTGKPVFATVATTGLFADLLSRPTTLAGYGITDADNSNTNEIQNLSLSGTQLSLSLGGGTVTLPSSGGGDNWGTQVVVSDATLTGTGTAASPLAVANSVITPAWANLQGIPAGFADGTDNVDDADNSITNEIQALSVNGSNLTLSQGGGTVTIPGDNWGTQTVATDGTLTGLGIASNPLQIANGGVTSAKILDGSILTQDFANLNVTADKLANNSVTTDKINAGAVTGIKIAQAGATTGQVLKWNGTLWGPGTDLNGQWTTSGSNIYFPGNVAIGMTLARYKLNLYGDDNVSIGFYNSTSGTSGTDGFTISTGATGSPVWIWNWENSNMHFATNNIRRLDILADGRIVMNSSLNINNGVSEGGALLVNGAQAIWWNGTYFSWGYGGTWNYFADRVSIGRAQDPTSSYMLYVQGSAYSTGSWTTSDARLKKNISEIDNPLSKLMKTRGTMFEFRTDEYEDYNFAGGTQIGFIAQEIEDIFPEVVNTDNNGYKSVNYNSMVPVLLEAIKEQQHIIDGIEAENNELKTRLCKLEQMLTVLVNR